MEAIDIFKLITDELCIYPDKKIAPSGSPRISSGSLAGFLHNKIRN